jgi:hypothetical protein
MVADCATLAAAMLACGTIDWLCVDPLATAFGEGCPVTTLPVLCAIAGTAPEV